MEIVNVRIENMNLIGTKKTKAVKNVKTWRAFKKNLDAGKKEEDFTGIGPYLEVEAKEEKDSVSLTVKVPFFLASEKGKFVDADKVNRVNPLAIKIIEEFYKDHHPTFDIGAYVTSETARIDAEITALGATPDPDRLAALNDERARVTALKKKDTQRFLRAQVETLEEEPNEIDLSGIRSNKAKVAAMQTFVSNKIKLLNYKEVLKHVKWSEKRGFSKLNNKFFKSGLALVLAGGLAFSATVTKLFGLWPKVKESKNKTKIVSQINGDSSVKETVDENGNTVITITPLPSIKPTAVINPTATATMKPTATPTKKPTPTPTVKPTKEPTPTPKPSLNSTEFNTKYESNKAKFNGVKSNISGYYNYDECVKAYTIIENLDDLDVSSLSRKELDKYIGNARALIAFAITSNPVCTDYMDIRESNHQIVQDVLDGNYASAINFVRNASEAGEPLTDMLAVGQLLQASSGFVGKDSQEFDTKFYPTEINQYMDKILKGEYQISFVEPAKTLKIGVYPNV